MANEDQRVAQQAINPPQFVPPLLTEDESAYAKGFLGGLYDSALPMMGALGPLSPSPFSTFKNLLSGAQTLQGIMSSVEGAGIPINNLYSPFSPQNISRNVQQFGSALTSLWGTPLIGRNQSPRGENVDIRTSDMEDLPMGEPTRLALQEAGWRRQGQQQLAQQDFARRERIAALDRETASREAAKNARYNEMMRIPLANAASAASPATPSGGTLAGWNNLRANQSMLSQQQPSTGFMSHPMGFGGKLWQIPQNLQQFNQRMATAQAPSYQLPGGGTVSGWGPKIKETAMAMRTNAANQKAEQAGLRKNWSDFWAQRQQQSKQNEADYRAKAREIAASRMEREAETIMGKNRGKFSAQAAERARQKALGAQQIRSGAFGEEGFMGGVGGQAQTPYRFDVASGQFVATSPSNVKNTKGAPMSREDKDFMASLQQRMAPQPFSLSLTPNSRQQYPFMAQM